MATPSKRKLRTSQPFEIPAELERLMTPLEDVRTYEGNPRRGDIEEIKTSLRANGLYRAPIARRQTGEILVNNHTVMACRELGATAIPIDWRSIESDDAARDIVLVDNATSDRAGYDDRALAELLEKAASSRRGLEGTGYDEGHLTELLAKTAPSRDRVDPEPPARPKSPSSKRGRVYKLGPHRLMCGDATEEKAYAKLLDGATIDVTWTDPPYGVDLGPLAKRRGRDHGDMAADQDLDAALEIARPALEHARQATRAGGALYLCHPDTHGAAFRTAMTEAGWQLRQVLVWIKNTLVLGRQDYQWRHEPILYGWKAGAAHRWFGAFDKTTVIENPIRDALEALEHEDLVELAWRLIEERPGSIIRADRPRIAEHHPTSKPPDMIASHLRNSSPAGGAVLDPFGGSGSTMVAAERTGRTAYLVELDPGYCDVIRQRYEELEDRR